MTPELLAARQELLRLEHEAIWTFETIAARSSELSNLAKQSAAARRLVRDDLRELVSEAGENPATPLPGYPSATLVDLASMQLAARALLAAIMECQLEIISLTTATERLQTIEWFTATSVSVAEWGEQPQAFPGLTSN